MKRLYIFATFIALVFCIYGNAQKNKTMDEHFELTPKTAHPNAKKLLKEDFYWNPMEETSPFGNDDGSDAFHNFRDWRSTNQTSSPVTFLKELIMNWKFPPFDLNEMDTTKIGQYLSAKAQIGKFEIEKDFPEILELFKNMGDSSSKQVDEAQLKEILDATANSMGATYLIAQDNAIIAVGFGQFVLEGKIDEDIKELTKTAIRRELLPLLIDLWPVGYKNTRKKHLMKMLAVVELMNK